jgi:hypothetical protein
MPYFSPQNPAEPRSIGARQCAICIILTLSQWPGRPRLKHFPALEYYGSGQQ